MNNVTSSWLLVILLSQDSHGRLFTRDLSQNTVLSNQWAAGFLYKRVD